MSSVSRFLLNVSAQILSVLFAVGGGTARGQSAQAWGQNDGGQLGNSTYNNNSAPAAVSGLTSGVTAIGGGEYHSLAIQNGAVYAWGNNVYTGYTDASVSFSSTPVAISNLTTGVAAVAAGDDHSLALQNGAVYAWGHNTVGQLGNGTTSYSSTPTPTMVGGLASGVTAIDAGNAYSLALQNNAVYAWGDNTYNQLGNGSGAAYSGTPVAVSGLDGDVVAITAGTFHGLAIQKGAIYAWGRNTYGGLGDGTTTNRSMPVRVTGLTDSVSAVAAGEFHSLAIKNGNVYAWGYNNVGQLGNGTYINSSTPVKIDPTNLNSIVAVAAGSDSSYALSSDGSLWVWGYNEYGQLGLGTSTYEYPVPQHLLPPNGYVYTSMNIGSEGSDVLAILTPALPKFTGLSRLAEGHFVLSATGGAPNTPYTIQASPDLSTNSFSSIGSATTDATGSIRYDDAGAVSRTQRFYRLTYP